MTDPIEVIHLKADKNPDDVKLVITGSVHGNEHCGEIAIRRFLKQLETGEIELLAGEIKFLPCCNPKAAKEDKRYIDVNLNRVIGHYDAPSNYEESLATKIAPHLDWSTHVLDIHSYTSDDTPFVFCDRVKDGIVEFAKQTYCAHMILDMTAMVAKKGSKAYNSVKSYSLGSGSIACTLECGQHKSENSPEVAYQSILNVLAYLGFIDGSFAKIKELEKAVVSDNIFYKERAGSFTQRWHNFQSVKAGTVIAKHDDGEEIKVDQDRVIYLPRDGEVGAEWFYTATEEKNI